MTYYLRYRLKNTTPLRIADDGMAQRGQTATLRYIPASSIRGMVISKLAEEGFNCDKENLFIKTRFLNAYPVVSSDGKEEAAIPSPKGFYEDKTETDDKKELKSIVKGEGIEGLKRARLGEFCGASGDTLVTCKVRTGSDLKIRLDGKDMFRNEYIDKGHVFEGAVASEDREFLEKSIKPLISQEIFVGNGRHNGLGRCTVQECEVTEDMPYASYAVDKDFPDECYMMLLSPTCMRSKADQFISSGEALGIDEVALGETMGVKGLKINTCATSTREIFGYNRTWGAHVPSLMTYDKGSVFRLQYEGTLTANRARDIMNQGIGDRRYEGFGRVVFLSDYETWKYRADSSNQKPFLGVGDESLGGEDREMLVRVARKYYQGAIREAMDRYVVDNPLGKGALNSSKTRAIEPILATNKYDFERARRLLVEYFGHELEKKEKQRVHQKVTNSAQMGEHVLAVLDGDLEDILKVKTHEGSSVMTIPKKEILTDEELGRLKLEFLIKELRFDGRKEGLR